MNDSDEVRLIGCWVYVSVICLCVRRMVVIYEVVVEASVCLDYGYYIYLCLVSLYAWINDNYEIAGVILAYDVDSGDVE